MKHSLKILYFPSLYIGDSLLTYVTKHKFLSLFFDGPRLNTTHHINYLKICCNKNLLL